MHTGPGFDTTGAALGARTDATGQSESTAEESALFSIRKLRTDRAMPHARCFPKHLDKNDRLRSTPTSRRLLRRKTIRTTSGTCGVWLFKALTEEEHDAQK